MRERERERERSKMFFPKHFFCFPSRSITKKIGSSVRRESKSIFPISFLQIEKAKKHEFVLTTDKKLQR